MAVPRQYSVRRSVELKIVCVRVRVRAERSARLLPRCVCSASSLSGPGAPSSDRDTPSSSSISRCDSTSLPWLTVVVLDWIRLPASSGSPGGPYGRSGPRRSRSAYRPPSSWGPDARIAPIGAACPARPAAHAPMPTFAIASVAG